MGNTTSNSNSNSIGHGNTDNNNSSLYSTRVETLVLSTPLDMERAMASTHTPKRINVDAKLLTYQSSSSHSHPLNRNNNTNTNSNSSSNFQNRARDYIRRHTPRNRHETPPTDLQLLLHRVGCYEICIFGKSATVPRRVFEHELVELLQSIPRVEHRLTKVILKNLNVHRLVAAAPPAPQQQQQAVVVTTDEFGVTLPHHRTLKQQLLRSKHLQEFQLQSCRMDEATLLTDLIEAVEVMKTQLKHVTFNLTDPIGRRETRQLLFRTMTTLLSSKRSNIRKYNQNHPLTSLALSEYPNSIAFWKEIAASKTLTHLSLRLDGMDHHVDTDTNSDTNPMDSSTSSSSDETSQSSRRAHHQLEEQQLYWDLLQENTSILQLELQVGQFQRCNCPRTPAGIQVSPLQPLFELLKDNTTLRSLLLHLNGPNAATTTATQAPPPPTQRQHPLAPVDPPHDHHHGQDHYCLNPTQVANDLTIQVLEYKNYTLQSINLLCYNIYGFKVRIPHTQLDFFTKLNRQGRQRLLLSTDSDDGDSDSDDDNSDDDDNNHYWSNSLRSTNKTSACGAHTTHTALSERSTSHASSASIISNSNKAWVDTALAANSYDVPSTYYWLQSNPNLFHACRSSSTKNNTTGSAKRTAGMVY